MSSRLKNLSQQQQPDRPTDPAVLAREKGVVIKEQPPKPTRRGRSEPQQARAPPDQLAYSIDQFCRAHAISVSMYFKMQAQGLGPRIIKLGTRTLITVEAARDWRATLEAETAAAAAVDSALSAGTTAKIAPNTVQQQRGRRRPARQREAAA